MFCVLIFSRFYLGHTDFEKKKILLRILISGLDDRVEMVRAVDIADMFLKTARIDLVRIC